MQQRIFGKTGRAVSEIGLGTWQLGTRWGNPFNHEEAMKILQTAEESGITFIDTADVYNGGKSEETIGEYIAAHPGRFYVTTKCGRRLNPHTADLAPWAIRWILMHPEVSVVIPGASKAAQVSANVKAAELPALTQAQMDAVVAVYDRYLRAIIHPQW